MRLGRLAPFWGRVCVGFVLSLALTGCAGLRGGTPPETVPAVDLSRYVGTWYEIASYPQFFNRSLVATTATYALLEDGRVSVFNRGLRNSFDGAESTILGKARVVDTATNSKLAVRFDEFPVNLFEGKYWIVLLEDDYQWAVVSDPARSTLFILSRTAHLDDAVYTDILEQLRAKGFDTDKLHVTPQP